MDLLTVLIIDLFFILFTTLAFQFIFLGKYLSFYNRFKKPSLTLLGGVQIVFCITFSLIATENYIFDLRLIPMVLGGLYGGPQVSISLFLIAAAARFPIGGNGMWLSFFNTLTITVLISYISIKFRDYRLAQKLYTVGGIGISYTILVFLMKAVVFKEPSDYPFILTYGTVLTLGILMTTYFIELTNQNHFLHYAMVKSDKIEVVSHLAASVSHEVRNPLTVTRGFLQMLKDPSIAEEKRLYYLNTAIDELDRAETIIKDYLAFAKPHNENTTVICIKEEIEKSLELIIPYANHYSITIKKDLTSGIYISGDVAKFHQCIINLIKNGIEAMPEGGDLMISSFKKGDGFVSIVIKDTGCGMTPVQISKLGEPYYSTKAEKGTGLGMMVVYKIIQEMGGSIEVKSELNEGSQFSILLPLYQIK